MPEQTTGKVVLTAKEAARLVRVDEATLRRKLKRGEFATCAIKIGRDWRINRTRLLRFLQVD